MVGQFTLFDITSVSFLILLISLAISTVVLYRRFVSRRALLQRVAELEALSRAGASLVTSRLDLEALCELIYQETGRLVDTRTFQVGLFENNHYHIRVWILDGERQAPVSFDLSENAGLVGWVRDNRRSLLVKDFEKELDKLPSKPRYISQTPPRSAIFIPLVSGLQVFGILAAQSDQPHRFDENDLRLLTIIGNQAGAAIANAQLYQRERTRAAQMALVNNIAQQVNASASLDDIFQQVVRLTSEQFNFHLVNIFGYEAETEQLVVKASSDPDLNKMNIAIPPEWGLIGAAFAGQSSVVVNNIHTDTRYQLGLGDADLDGIGAETNAEIAIPLMVEDEPLGVLDVHSAQLGAFSTPEQTALEALAAQIATAINQARQIEIQREQAWLTTAQLQVAEAISRSENLESLLEAIPRLVSLLLGVHGCAILLWDNDISLYQAAAIYSDEAEEKQRFEHLQFPVGKWTPLDAVHVGQEAVTSRRRPPWSQRWEAVTLYPLVAKGEMEGVMVIYPPGERYTQRELLRNISTQTAQAINNAQLDIAQQEEAWVNTALLQVAEAVNSLTDVQDILSTIVRIVPMLVGVDMCIALVYNEEENSFHAGPSHGLSDMGRGLLESFEIPASEIPVMTGREEDFVRPAPTFYELKLPEWMQTSLRTNIASAFPLHARNRLVGALVVGQPTNGRPLNGRRLSILAGVAHQAATALVNDHLYQEAAERQKLTRELQVAREIQASLLPQARPDIPGCDIDSTWYAAREVSGDFYDFLPFGNHLWGIVVADVADKGIPAALFMAVSRTILRAVAFSRIHPGETLERVNELLWGDSSSDLFVTIFYAVWDSHHHKLSYASAGHNPALLMRANGSYRLLNTEGMALGVLEHVRIEQREVRLLPGDIVVFYTDGVTEAMNEDFDEFDLDRLQATVMTNRKKSAAGISKAVLHAVEEHAGDAAQFDDITLVVFKRDA